MTRGGVGRTVSLTPTYDEGGGGAGKDLARGERAGEYSVVGDDRLVPGKAAVGDAWGGHGDPIAETKLRGVLSVDEVVVGVVAVELEPRLMQARCGAADPDAALAQ